MPGYDAYRGTRVFASLDGLRCLSILAVIWHHCGWQAAPWALLQMGYRGVDLFFVISGFLITTLLLREREETGRVSLREFWIRRALPGLELLWLPATLALTVLVAGLSFRYYESHFLRLKKRFQWSERTARVRRDSAGAGLSSPKTVRA